jgi:hypothetical protein
MKCVKLLLFVFNLVIFVSISISFGMLTTRVCRIVDKSDAPEVKLHWDIGHTSRLFKHIATLTLDENSETTVKFVLSTHNITMTLISSFSDSQ